jgi:hypothetical protein
LQYDERDPKLTLHSVGGESGVNTTTVSVAAGSSVAFTSDVAVYHDGPISVYMAKATTTAAAFDGSGDVWFKILDIGPIFPGGTWDLKRAYPGKNASFNFKSLIEM